MQPSRLSARSLLSLAVVIMAAIVGWRISSPVVVILHDYHVHLTATVPHPAAPKVIHVPPKVAAITCQR